MPTTESVERVCFTIEGQALTRIARDFVSERNWREAVALLTENLRPDFTHEMAVDVLSGKKKLTGDSTVGLDLARDCDKETKEYREHLKFLYAGTYRDLSHALFMQPYAIVVCWGPADLPGPGENLNRWCGHRLVRSLGSREETNDSIWRSLWYADDLRNDRVFLLLADRDDMVRQEQAIIFRIVPAPPLWVPVHMEPQDALDAWVKVKGNALDERGSSDCRWSGEHDRAAERWDINVSHRKAKTPKTGNEVVDEYLRDPDGTIAKLAKKTNQEISAEVGESFEDVLYDECNNGWLNPTGKIETCQYGLHSLTAAELSDEPNAGYALEKSGWIKLTKGRWMFAGVKPTKQQQDAVMNWYTDRGEKTPNDVLKKLEGE